MKNIKIAIKISIFSISILIVGLFGLWLAANQQMSKMMKASIVQQLVHSVETQAEIVRAYVDTAEMYLIGYAQAPIMTETLKSPQNTQAAAKLQEYTDTYAAIRNDLENIYVADYGSTVIASHVQGVIGATLREGTALKQLQDAIGQGMYNIQLFLKQSHVPGCNGMPGGCHGGDIIQHMAFRLFQGSEIGNHLLRLHHHLPQEKNTGAYDL